MTANLLDPRMAKGEFGREFEGAAPVRLMFRIVPLFVATGTEQSAEQYIRLATDPALGNVTGMYFVSGKEKPEDSSKLSLDPVTQRRINDVAEDWAAPFLRGRLPSSTFVARVSSGPEGE